MSRRPLAPPRAEPAPAAPEGGGSGDLFEHFGVEVEASRGRPSPVVDGQPCSNCGWLLRAVDDERCPLCGRRPPRSTTTG
ncbi:hypothetical protein [Enhygromyxa salina]|uniref:hypothetical protein n=1 Tax=Enhygromyxa salina TaxID=215803 RepID=UPI0015E5A3D2|nr:hypothetical protein [Enhygromyxa salina]